MLAACLLALISAAYQRVGWPPWIEGLAGAFHTHDRQGVSIEQLELYQHGRLLPDACAPRSVEGGIFLTTWL
jgi:hypothetical protein